MKGRPPKRALSAAQERAASAFVQAAESPAAGSGGGDAAETPPTNAQRASARATSGRPDETLARPWEDPRAREDVTKGYALRLPEPLYLQLKWVAEQTGRSINTVCREAVAEEVARHLPS